MTIQLIKKAVFFSVSAFLCSATNAEGLFYPKIKNYSAQQPDQFYADIKIISNESICFDLEELKPKAFPKEYREYPTIQSKSERFDFSRFAQSNRIPIPLYTMTETETNTFHADTRYLVQDMVIKIPHNSKIAISKSHEQFLPMIQKVFAYEKQENTHLDDYYAYLTIDQREVTQGTSLRSPGWHIDGMHRRNPNEQNERISRVYTIVVTDSGENITEFVDQSFPEVVDLPPDKYNFFKAFEYLVMPSSIHSALPNTIYYMDAYTVHRSPIAKSSNVGKRTFLRIQFTPKEFNRLGNTKNAYFKDVFIYTKQDFPLLKDPVFLKKNPKSLNPNPLTVSKKAFQSLHDKNYILPTKSKTALRILSWNVRHFRDLDNNDSLDNIISALQKTGADIIALQEGFQNGALEENQIQYIEHPWEKSLHSISVDGKPYQIIKCFADHKRYPTDHLRQQALIIATTAPISEQTNHIFPDNLQYLPWPDSRLGFQVVRLATTVGEIAIVNTHLDVMDQSGQKRMAQLQLILDHIDHNIPQSIPVFLMGDFNAVNFHQIVDNGQLQTILEQDITRSIPTPLFELNVLYDDGFLESFDLAYKKAPQTTVWSMRRVDYIFLRNGDKFKLVPQIIPWVYSDHLPILLDVEP